MTELRLEVTDASTALLEVKIDLGQSLLSEQTYWAATQASSSDVQRQHLQPALERLAEGIHLSAQGQRLTLNIRSWKLEAVSLEAIRNPLTPQMAHLEFSVDTPPGLALDYAVFSLSVDKQLDIPWPALLRADLPQARLPISRLLSADRRYSDTFSAESQRNDSAGEAKMWQADLATWFQSWVPGVTWVAVGFQHIIPWGLDHIVFVLGLFFLAPKASTLLYQVSCFTLAHSLTLGLASLGLVSVPASVIEPLIAASIVYVALDNLYSHQLARWRLAVVTLFGLLHGLGFASALSELSIPEEQFIESLLLFNLGVEVGQLAVLGIAFLAVGWLRHWSGYADNVARPATVTIAGVGAYWLIKRVVL